MTCHSCLINCAKAGKRSDGLQRYRCTQCGKTFSDRKEHENLFGHKQAVDDDAALLTLKLLVEGNSIRSTQRITGLDKKTIMRLLVTAGERCQILMETKVRNVPVKDVQCDEIWSYVQKKESRRFYGDKDFDFVGDAWTFIGIERNSKLVLAFELGKRNTVVASRFMAKIAVAASAENRFQLTTDGFAPYVHAVGTRLDGRCDYSQLVKVYASATAEEQRRYSPGVVIGAESTDIYGDPERARICTSHIERQNGSLRQWCKRLTRLTYAFSKKWDHLKAALALHFAYYNFCRVHRTIKMTPAMAAGITDRVWSLADLVTA